MPTESTPIDAADNNLFLQAFYIHTAIGSNIFQNDQLLHWMVTK